MSDQTVFGQAAKTGKAAATAVSSLLTTKQPDTIKKIQESNSSIEILMYANKKLTEFFQSMYNNTTDKVDANYFDKFNLEYVNTELNNIKKIQAYENTKMNILKEPYITELKIYLNDPKKNILNQYIELLKHLINLEPSEPTSPEPTSP